MIHLLFWYSFFKNKYLPSWLGPISFHWKILPLDTLLNFCCKQVFLWCGTICVTERTWAPKKHSNRLIGDEKWETVTAWEGNPGLFHLLTWSTRPCAISVTSQGFWLSVTTPHPSVPSKCQLPCWLQSGNTALPFCAPAAAAASSPGARQRGSIADSGVMQLPPAEDETPAYPGD